MNELRLPPQSLESEQSVLGGLMTNSRAIHRIDLQATHFYAGQHRVIFQTITDMAESGEEVDVLTVADRMALNGTLEQAGGIPYLHQLAESTPSVANIGLYADIVRDRYAMREVARVGNEIADSACAANGKNAAVLIDEAQAAVMALSSERILESAGIAPRLVEFRETLRRRYSGEAVSTPTGLVDLDRLLQGGLRDGDLVIVAGRPSMGKSAFACQIADTVAQSGKPVLIFTMEMSATQCLNRTVSRLSDTPLHDILDGSAYTRGSIAEAEKKIATWAMEIDDRPALSIGQLRAKARDVKRKSGLGLIVVDYLQLMSAKQESRRLEIEEISRGLKQLAKELLVPVVALSQLSRKCEERPDKRPMMSDLRESGSLEQDADAIMFVYREEVYKPDDQDWHGIAEILIAKNRDGVTGRVPLTYLGSRTQFKNFGGQLPSRQPVRAVRRAFEEAA